MKKNYTLSTQAAASLLAAQTGEPPEHWQTRLRNWRKPDRTSPLSWSVDTPRPKYDQEELSAFIKERQQEFAALALRSADPTESLPKADASHVRNADARHMIQLSWTDQNASGVVVLAMSAARSLLEDLARAVASADAGFKNDFDTSMAMDVQALELRSMAVDSDGELPDLAEAQRRLGK